VSYREAAFIFALLTTQISTPARTATPADSPKVLANYGRIPLSFEANQGQSDAQVRFLARGRGYGIFLTGTDAVLALSKQNRKAKPELLNRAHGARIAGMTASSTTEAPERQITDVVRLELPGSRTGARPQGEDRLPGTANYFIGNDPSKWHTSVPTYARVRYAGVYDGVDLVYYGNQRQLEYDFAVSPHADPAQIRLRFAGAREIRLTTSGDLEVKGRHGQIVFHKPELYQEADGKRQPVEGSFVVEANHTVAFRVGRYNPEQPLTIDPVLVYSSYLGGSGNENGGDGANAIAVDKAGYAYVAGQTYSSDFPVTAGAVQRSNGAKHSLPNAFVTKLDPSGSALVYSTYLGGSGICDTYDGTTTCVGDGASGIALDSEGDAYITGSTGSFDFPVAAEAFQSKNKADWITAFVAKLDASGSALLYSTYLGGTGQEQGYAIAVDSSDSAYVTGGTISGDFPVTTGAFQTVLTTTDKYGVFVTKFSPSGSALDYSTFLTGLADQWGPTGEQPLAIALDSSNDAYVAGITISTTFPVTGNAFQKTNKSPAVGNAFVTKFNSTGSALLYSTYLGGSGFYGAPALGDYASAIAVDRSGDAYVAGFADSSDFPVTSGAFQRVNHGNKNHSNTAFITKLNPSGSSLIYSSYLGGSGVSAWYPIEGDIANGVALDAEGNVYVAGTTLSADFPTTGNALKKKYNSVNGSLSGFVTKLDSTGSNLLYSTYLGGSSSDSAEAIAVGSAGTVYVAGSANSRDFPVTSGAFQQTLKDGRGGNAFVAKLDLSPATATSLVSSEPTAPEGTETTFTASVFNVSNTPFGSVTFKIDGKAEATEKLNSAGEAAYSTKSLALGKHTVEAAYAGNADYSASKSSTLTETIILPEADAPIFSPAVGTYTSPQQVTLTDRTAGAHIHYTSDGASPTPSSPVYEGPITVDKTTTIMAVARADGYTNSVVAKGTYTIHLPPKVTTQAATNIDSSSATLNVLVKDDDQKGTVTFAWGTSKTALTSTSSAISLDASGSAQVVSMSVTGLAPGTTYFFQPTAKNEGGATHGAVASFTTK